MPIGLHARPGVGLSAIGVLTTGIMLGVRNKHVREIEREIRRRYGARRFQWDERSGIFVFWRRDHCGRATSLCTPPWSSKRLRHAIYTRLLLRLWRPRVRAALEMGDTVTIRCSGCGARIDARDSYAIREEHVCSAECARKILVQHCEQATDRLAVEYNEVLRRIERVRPSSS